MKTSPHQASKLSPQRHRTGGYILLELIIALTIFSLAVLNLARSLEATLAASNRINRDYAIRIGMRSLVEELRIKTLPEMSVSRIDEALGVTYTATTEPVAITTRSGGSLRDLYALTITATDGQGTEPLTDDVTVYVYKPRR